MRPYPKILKPCSDCSCERTHENSFSNTGRCKSCYSIYQKEQRLKHLEKRKLADRNKYIKYYEIKKEIICKKTREYAKNNRDKRNLTQQKYNNKPENKERLTQIRRQYELNRRKTDPIVKITKAVRDRLRDFLKYKGLDKKNSFKQYIGCTKEELKTHIESQFKPGMTWENHGFYGWHIDHIIPLSSANSEEQIYKLCHYTNLQPLWAKENLSKNNKIAA